MKYRLKTSKEEQKDFFRKIKISSGLGWDELGELCKISGRALRDWARAKYLPAYEASKILSNKFRINLPKGFKTLNPYWYITKENSKRGAFARLQLYGPPGNLETRRKGGIISQQRRRSNPEKYRLLGCKVRKIISPLQPSMELAEMCGILLGDGGITNNQIRVTLNSNTDIDYARFVRKLFNSVFKESPSVAKYGNVLDLTLSGVNLVEALEKIGLKRGNKVTNQVSVPEWILENHEYSKACVRGLIDTDGSVYYHHHVSHGFKFFNIGLTFTNHSLPLIHGVARILRDNKFSPSIMKEKKIYIYKLSEIKRYFEVIGTSNPKHLNRLNYYLSLSKK